MRFAREEWKKINLGEGFTNDLKLEVSNYGQVKSYSKSNNGNLLKGSTVNGYRIIRIKLFAPRSVEASELLNSMQSQTETHSKKISAFKKILLDKALEPHERIAIEQHLEAETVLLNNHKKIYNRVLRKDVLMRTTHWASLIHRMVAENFLKPGTPDQTIVAHIDYDKLNNVVSNLKWMNIRENIHHQQSSPHVIDKKEKKQQGGIHASSYKLTTTKVMFLKKLLNEGKPVRNLAKQFKITETQVIRILKNENWGSVKAAE